MDLLDKIIKAKEILSDDMAITIAEYLHIEKFDKHSLKGCCPFHKEDTPSFIWDKKDKCYSCFSGETEVITKDGVFPIIEIIDKEVEIINGNGEWEKVKFVNCGKQKLIKINLTSNGKIKEIFATPEHEWIVRKHKAKIQTKDLKSGYRLERVLPIRDRNFNIIPEGIIHGYVYGDGHISKRTDKKFRFCTTVYTKEKYDFIKQFVKITKPKCFEKNEKYKECFGYFHISSVINFKEIPDFKCHSLDYLYSFLIGYFVTDGCAKPSTTKNCNNALFASAKYDDLVKVKHICTLVGIATYPIGHTIRTPKSNGGILNYTHNYDLYYLRLVHSTIPNNFYLSSKKNDRKFTYSSYLGWKVVSIEETERYEDVYCTETSTHSFALKDFILTGNCFGCGRRYGIIDMYTETEGSYQSALKKLFKETGIEDKFSLNNNNEDYFKNYRFPKEETNTDRSRVDAYMAKRGISKETLDYAGIKQDQHGNVVFELRDFDNRLLAVKYRQSRAVPKGQAKMWYQKNADTCPSLFNLQNIDITQPLCICEGYGDCLSIIEAGYRNVVSIPSGATDLNWIEFNWDILEQIPEFILWFDNDRAGETGRTQTQQRLGEYRCKLVKPSQDDIAAVRAFYEPYGTIIEKTDANNILVSCGSQRILDLISQAEEIPSKKLKYLMDCEPTSIKDIEKFSFGIKKMDDILYGNLMGCFTIYSGKPGSGKSSLSNICSIIASAENDMKSFIFSGELGIGQLSDWIVQPLAGSNHILEISSSSQRMYYTVSKQALKEIKDFYRPKLLVYNDSDALETSGESILQAMEEAYRRNGCKTFLIDNLMCVSFNSESSDSKWDSQKKFIIKLMNFTLKYNVSTNLVVHPRKMNTGSEATTDSLHGASEIANLCHRLIWCSKLNPDESMYNMRLDIIKDRPSQAAGKKCELYYDEKTRRIYSDLDELKRKYSWEKQVHIQYSQEEDRHLVYHQLPITLPHEKSNYEPF